MIKSFQDKETERFLATGHSRKIGADIQERALKKLQILDAAQAIEDLRAPPSNNLEKLNGDRSGFWSIRVNKQWRIIFRFDDGNAFDVAFIDYH